MKGHAGRVEIPTTTLKCIKVYNNNNHDNSAITIDMHSGDPKPLR